MRINLASSAKGLYGNFSENFHKLFADRLIALSLVCKFPEKKHLPVFVQKLISHHLP